jgi:hypothetical protein
MKSLYYVLLLGLILLSCNSSKKEEIASSKNNIEETSEIETYPKATLITETLELTHAESVVYDSKLDRIFVSLIGNAEKGDGSIATISVDGKVLNKEFVSGLNDPKGIALTKDRIYVSDVTDLVEADSNTGEILNRYTVDGIQFLNDVAIGSDGSIYVSDTFTSTIYKLDTDKKFSLWLSDPLLDKPNGLLIEDKTMYVASWGGAPEGGRVIKIDMIEKIIVPVSEIIGNLDGIRPYDENHLIISDWRSGKIHLLNYNGTTKEVLTVGQSVGDIAYIKEKNLLLLPMNTQSRLLFYELK